MSRVCAGRESSREKKEGNIVVFAGLSDSPQLQDGGCTSFHEYSFSKAQRVPTRVVLVHDADVRLFISARATAKPSHPEQNRGSKVK